MLFSADEGAEVGSVGETDVSTGHPEGDDGFTGTIVRVTVEQL